MPYWRMQLHPSDSAESVQYSARCLAAGYIGLDFSGQVPDLMSMSSKANLPAGREDYWGFAHTMAVGDLVLIIAHHFPFALSRVSGEYNFIRATAPELGVWFRHFRAVDQVRFYADYKTDAHKW